MPLNAFVYNYPHMPIGKVWIHRLLFVFFFVCLFVRLRISQLKIKITVSNFRTAVRRRPRQGLSHFGELCFPEAPPVVQNRTNRPILRSLATTRMAHPKNFGPQASAQASARGPCAGRFAQRATHTQDRHVWIYDRPRQQTYLLLMFLVHYSSNAERGRNVIIFGVVFLLYL